MSENKTKVTDAPVTEFLNSIADEQKRKDCFLLLETMTELSKETAKMWGESIVGFGQYHYKYKSGRKGDFFRTGFSPRKQNLTVYIIPGFKNYESYLSQLGKYKTSVSCLYIKTLKDIDFEILRKIIAASLDEMKKLYPEK